MTRAACRSSSMSRMTMRRPSSTRARSASCAHSASRAARSSARAWTWALSPSRMVESAAASTSRNSFMLAGVGVEKGGVRPRDDGVRLDPPARLRAMLGDPSAWPDPRTAQVQGVRVLSSPSASVPRADSASASASGSISTSASGPRSSSASISGPPPKSASGARPVSSSTTSPEPPPRGPRGHHRRDLMAPSLPLREWSRPWWTQSQTQREAPGPHWRVVWCPWFRFGRSSAAPAARA